MNFGYKIQGLENHFGKSSFQAKINLILSSSNQKFLSDKGQRYLIGKQYLPGAFVDPQLVKIGAVLELAQSLDESMNTNRKLTKPQ
ncbi:hypothetical protein [Algoriphagus formosus]|uniref:Uncharacterized protein n=1 Tax=Algoriphagus formosus TaxID=2007308 RepID=A0A4R5VG26_9BACT|nr:hypothetical protein [Algoriphagus aquimaris]TDK51473.1 hypothetical protein E1898_00040 [Algoriphagus aquimaris]